MSIDFIREAPRTLRAKDDHAYSVAEQIASWIWDHATKEMSNARFTGRVIGLYGGRGSGKTSVLQTVLNTLRTRPSTPGQKPPVALPVPRNKDDPHAPEYIFSPTDLRDCDELLFALLDYLEEAYAPDSTNKPKETQGPFREAREAEVHRIELSRMLDWAKETATSTKDVPGKLVDQHYESTQTTKKLRAAFSTIIQNWTLAPHNDGNADRVEQSTLVLPIDDVDLQPHRTLELLELLHILLQNTRVIVIVAADRDLMLHSVMENLRERRMHQSGLAGALIAKYVPYHWNVPMPTANMRFDLVWDPKDENGKPIESTLRRYWKSTDNTIWAESIGPLLPRTYRGLIAFHNRLVSLWDEVYPKDEPRWRAQFEKACRNDLGLTVERVDPVLSLCVAVDMQRPELNVLHALMTDTKAFARAILPTSLEGEEDRALEPLERIALSIQSTIKPVEAIAKLLASQAQRSTGLLSQQDHEVPLLDRLGLPYIDGRLVGEARELLRGLANAIIEFQKESATATAEMRLLLVSLNANAFALAEPLRSQREYEQDQIIDVDLLQFGDGRRSTANELRHARDLLREAIENNQLRDRRGQIDLVARAHGSLIAWLGAYLPWQMLVVPQQIRPGAADAERVFEYRGAAELQRPRDVNRYDVLAPIPTTFGETGGDAVVILDLLRKSKPDDVDKFEDADERIVETNHKYRLQLKEQVNFIEPKDLLPILRDVAEFAYQLRKRNVERIHLGLLLPIEFAFFIGRELRAGGKVKLYEYYGDHYEYVFDLDS